MLYSGFNLSIQYCSAAKHIILGSRVPLGSIATPNLKSLIPNFAMARQISPEAVLGGIGAAYLRTRRPALGVPPT